MGDDWVKRYGYVLYLIHPDFELDGDGTMLTPQGHPAIKVKDKLVKVQPR